MNGSFQAEPMAKKTNPVKPQQGQYHHRHPEKILMLQNQNRKQFQLTYINGRTKKVSEGNGKNLKKCFCR